MTTVVAPVLVKVATPFGTVVGVQLLFSAHSMVAAVAANPSRVGGVCRDDAKRLSGEQHDQRVPRNRPLAPPAICDRNFRTGHVALLRLH